MKEGNETSLIAEQKKLNEIKAKLSNVPEFIEYSRTLSQDVLWNKYKTDLAELNLRSIGASFEYGDKSSNVKALLAQTDEINKEMMALAKEKMSVSATTESRNPTYQSLLDGIIDSELRIISYTATRDMADRLLKQANTERDRIFLEMPENQYQVGKMNREVGYKVDIYKDLLTKKIESEIMANENISDGLKIRGGIEIVDPAQPNSRPISPRIKFITLIAGVMGLAVGLSMAFLAEYFEKPIG
jgi:uncharacterized protein involved in exopolysaccharide biosynthesis